MRWFGAPRLLASYNAYHLAKHGGFTKRSLDLMFTCNKKLLELINRAPDGHRTLKLEAARFQSWEWTTRN
jgi:hypothetical protein